MSTLNEEVARLKQAKSSIAAAIAGKGVEVPSDALLDTYGDYVYQIEVGSTVEGITSASVTAKRSDVAKGVTTVTSDSYDAVVEGTLELSGNAIPENVLEGVTFYNDDLYTKLVGTMANMGGQNASLDCGESYNIPKGYHDGSGIITANDLASQTVGTATSGDILNGESAWVNGEEIVGSLQLAGNASATQVLSGATFYNTDVKEIQTGSMPNNGAVAPSALGAGGSYTIPAGYHNGSGKVTVQSLATMTASGDATAAQILSGKKAYVDGNLITGNMTDRGAVAPSALAAGGSYTIPAGYHNGSGKVTVQSLATMTASGDAAAGDILSGKKAYVDGSLITGSMGTLAGGTYTPSTSQQTISCSGKKMTSNIVIAAIPSNYINITGGMTFFKNGAFGAAFSTLSGKAYVSPNWWIHRSDGWVEMSSSNPYYVYSTSGNETFIGHNIVNSYWTATDYDVPMEWSINRTIDLTKFSKITLIDRTNKSSKGGIYLWAFELNSLLGRQIESPTLSSDVWTTVTLDVSMMKGQCVIGFSLPNNYSNVKHEIQELSIA